MNKNWSAIHNNRAASRIQIQFVTQSVNIASKNRFIFAKPAAAAKSVNINQLKRKRRTRTQRTTKNQ